MAIATNKILRLSFSTAGGKTFTLTIPNPREDLSQAEILAVMDKMISEDILMTTSGAITGVKDIRVVNTVINDLFDPVQP
ncbi:MULTISPECIES: DUF2922 domain-containing protein [Desulfitobacterium]|uniref:DUF2922 domain-containing protein n=1 Tax=Desulfitobacterium dehalogenans (strain ATCC 51507 / DSM 9161 / JW/IU-DC1) TaxID=756499 RepID=I4A4Y3_DESDJ|nr:MULTISPECIES: DUF2922 domain-containing protein [Desulfitobacterium]AFL99017.1 Protein of unknown function (DUF2922) [Desulfitobacterium dehalogenans ATCC 51507]